MDPSFNEPLRPYFSRSTSCNLFDCEALRLQNIELENELQEATSLYDFWVASASSRNINVNKTIDRMKVVLDSLPSREDGSQVLTVNLLYELTMRTIYCNKIIRKIAVDLIKKKTKAALDLPEFINKHGLIHMSQEYLMKLLPSKMTNQPIIKTGWQYNKIESEIDRITDQLFRSAKVY